MGRHCARRPCRGAVAAANEADIDDQFDDVAEVVLGAGGEVVVVSADHAHHETRYASVSIPDVRCGTRCPRSFVSMVP